MERSGRLSLLESERRVGAQVKELRAGEDRTGTANLNELIHKELSNRAGRPGDVSV